MDMQILKQINHWAACARLTSECSSVVHADFLEKAADHITSIESQLEAAQQEIDGLKVWKKIAAGRYEKLQELKSKLEKAEAELSAANERVLREYPATLPCPVRLEPGLILGKGLPIAMLFRALSRRADYEAEIVAMTPEQRAEHDQRTREVKKFISECIAPRVAGFKVEGE
ncbi:TPA: hypothetical protein PXN07_004055 [Yersinia enterocolitica]|uniref:hypothetical protein n=1 Tax=Yersinia sp. LJYL362 TaxID=3402108 RepID=UPI0028616F69|nr:hypothetical protein [Yersinia enterocolitica]HDL7338747.1 hypothetical protein [Yersinia enterocolitica]HDV7153733.1 hypothetical protein [Yersinia enterocolitica]